MTMRYPYCFLLLFLASCSPHFAIMDVPTGPTGAPSPITPPIVETPPPPPSPPRPAPPPLPKMPKIITPSKKSSKAAKDVATIKFCEELKLLENDTWHRLAEEPSAAVREIYQNSLNDSIEPALNKCKKLGIIE